MKYPRASGALRRAPDHMLKRAHFTRTTLLCTVSNLGLSRSRAPPDQILDPPRYPGTKPQHWQIWWAFSPKSARVIGPHPPNGSTPPMGNPGSATPQLETSGGCSWDHDSVPRCVNVYMDRARA